MKSYFFQQQFLTPVTLSKLKGMKQIQTVIPIALISQIIVGKKPNQTHMRKKQNMWKKFPLSSLRPKRKLITVDKQRMAVS